MLNGSDLLVAMKKAALEGVENSKPVAVVFGTVVGVKPLRIEVEQKLTLSEAQLVLCRGVKDFEVEMSVDHITEDISGGSGDSAFASHNHGYTGRKKFIVHNNLALGEVVVMLRVQGGQKFLVLDRLG